MRITLFITIFFIINCTLYGKLQPVDLVYPLLDTENSRWFFFSSASRPFGMVNLSPDTEVDGAWGSGYNYNTTNIKGFSHIHAWQMSGISVMPVDLSDEKEDYIFRDCTSNFLHSNETVKPGYHHLFLDRYSIDVELTSTKRVGFHKLKYNSKKNKGVLFNLNCILGPCENYGGDLRKIDDFTMKGTLFNSPTVRRPKAFQVFFIVKFDTKISSIIKDELSGNFLVKLSDDDCMLKMKVAVSYTSYDNANNNMEKELNHWNFNKCKKDSFDEWNSLLSRIEINGGCKDSIRRFYTDLWHALQGRRVINDVDGAYPDYTGDKFRIGYIKLNNDGLPEHNHYNSDAFWGAQFSLNTLWGLVYPDIYEDFVKSLMLYYKDGGLIPRGPSGGNYTYVMTGASSTPFIVSAIQKGIVSYDLDYIYSAVRKNHMPGGIMEKAGYEHNTNKGGGLKYYMSLGYVPYPNPEKSKAFHQDGAGITMECAYQDYALSQFALKLGNKNDYQYFYERSLNYKNLFDKQTGWIRPKDINGKWKVDFDPYEYKSGFVESNSAQMTWFVPHDIDGLAKLMGGYDVAVQRLDAQFKEAEKLNFTSGTSHSQELHPEYSRIPINYGNQPSIHTAFIFHKLNRPDLSQYWSSLVVEKSYSALDTSNGYNGDEDQGIMGSIAVLMKLGLFQLEGGVSIVPEYQIGSPSFDKITIHLNGKYYKGKSIEISVKRGSQQSYVIERMYWNNDVVDNYVIKHEKLIEGGKLVLVTK